MNRSEDLRGQTAVVTGAASGIGRSIALKLAESGADLLIHTRAREIEAKQVCADIRRLGRTCELLVTDYVDPQNQDALVDWAWQQSEQIGVWINNAGGDVLTGPPSEMTFDEKLAYLWQVDVAATVRISRNVGQRMRERSQQPGDHLLVNIGWDQAELGMAGDSGEMFSTTKAAVMAFSRSLAQSLAPHVRVNCLAPGWIQTAWGTTANEYWQHRATAESLLQRWGQPEDIANTCLFLATSGKFINGQVISVNGGRAFQNVERKT